MPRVTIEPSGDQADSFVPMSLWKSDDGFVYALHKIDGRFRAISVDGTHCWDVAHDSSMKAVEGLVPFYGKVIIEN